MFSCVYLGVEILTISAAFHISRPRSLGHVIPGGYFALARYWLTRGYTPLFEWLCKDVVVGVVRPQQDRLMLLALRENSSGRYVDPVELHQTAMAYGVPLAALMDVPQEVLEGKGSEAIVRGLQHHVRDLDTGIEGGCELRNNICAQPQNITSRSRLRIFCIYINIIHVRLPHTFYALLPLVCCNVRTDVCTSSKPFGGYRCRLRPRR